MVTFEVSADQRQLLTWAHGFAERHIRPRAPRYDESGEFPRDLINSAAAAGFMDYFLPCTDDDIISTTSNMLIVEELFWGCAGIASILSMHQVATLPFAMGGWLDRLSSTNSDVSSYPSSNLMTIIIPDPTRELSDHLEVVCVEQSDGTMCLSGPAYDVINARSARTFIVFAHVLRENGPRGIGLFSVPSTRQGVGIGPRKSVGLQAAWISDVSFDAIILDESEIVSKDNVRELAIKTYEYLQAYLAVAAIGVGRAALEDARSMFSSDDAGAGTGLYSEAGNRFVSQVLDLCAVELQSARLLARHLGWLLDINRGSMDEATSTCTVSTDAAMGAVKAAIDLIGGQGRVRAFSVEKWLRDLRALRSCAAHQSIQRW